MMKLVLVVGLTGLVTSVMAHPRGHQSFTPLARRKVDISKLSMPVLSNYVNATDSQDSELVKSMGKRTDYVTAATELVNKVVPGAESRLVGDHYVDSHGVAHANFKQTMDGVDIVNGDFHVNVDINDKMNILSYGHSFYMGDGPQEKLLLKRDFADPMGALQGVIDTLGLNISTSNATVMAKKDGEPAVIDAPRVNNATAAPNNGSRPSGPAADTGHVVLEGTGGTVSPPEARPVYIQTPNRTLARVWRVETRVTGDWLVSYAAADDPRKLLGVVSYGSDLASFEVLPWGVKNPAEGQRVVVEDPWSQTASPMTWVSTQPGGPSTTSGNNIEAFHFAWGQPQSPNQPDLRFEYPYSPNQAEYQAYADASLTQAFYTTNKYHDLLYMLGFQETSGNFQTDNNGQGGWGNDAVEIIVQDPSQFDNPRFYSGPEGSRPRMVLTMSTKSWPLRDSSFDAHVVLHEYTHGLSTRLTGGPYNAECLSGGESGGMGEGWSDFMALAALLKATDTRNTEHAVGAWLFNRPSGIRIAPYTTNTQRNGVSYRTCDSFDARGQVHEIGTVWATALYEVLWNLIDKHGITDKDMPEFNEKRVATDGRYLTMQLVIRGMAMQSCNPTMIMGRDAIIDADRSLNGGSNHCELWRGFAKRGLGVSAQANHGYGRRDDFSVPVDCSS